MSKWGNEELCAQVSMGVPCRSVLYLSSVNTFLGPGGRAQCWSVICNAVRPDREVSFWPPRNEELQARQSVLMSLLTAAVGGRRYAGSSASQLLGVGTGTVVLFWQMQFLEAGCVLNILNAYEMKLMIYHFFFLFPNCRNSFPRNQIVLCFCLALITRSDPITW